MERKDQKKTVYEKWEANYNAVGRATHDESTTELSGSRREADLVVSGLKALRVLTEMGKVAGFQTVEGNSFSSSPLNNPLTTEEIDRLISQIENPNYVGEPIVERR
jgi:hypothetical protein